MRKRLFIIHLLLLFIGKIIAQNQNLSNGNVFEGEPFIAVNPTNSQNVVVAWMGYVFNYGSGLTIKIKSSFNGGQTWSSTINMPHIVSTYKSADPSMVFDSNGNLFLSYIDHRENPDSGGVYLFKSTNGGLTWNNPVKMMDASADGEKIPIDRPWLVINNAGDKLYLTTKPAPWISAPNRPYFTASIDSGTTWKPWRYIDTTAYLVGNLIAAPMAAPAATGNKFYAVYPSYVSSQNIFPQYFLASTNNSGNSFSYSMVLSGNNMPNNDTAKAGYKLLTDPSDTNHLVFVYPYFSDMDVMMTESFNAGIDWTTPIRINDDTQGNGKMQDLIWADFDNDGDLVISWRDRRNANGAGYATASEFYAAFRNKDSANFTANFKLSDSLVAYNSILEQNGNDFMGADLTNDTISAVWANTRDGSLDVWFVRIAASTGHVTSASLIESEPIDLTVFPNPSPGVYYVEMNNKSIINEINVFDADGKNIFNTKINSSKYEIVLSDKPPGIYFLKIRYDRGIITKRIIR